MVQRKRGQDIQPVPLIDPTRCDGCGLCLRACPTGALALHGDKAIVAYPEACDYTGLCEMICPQQAILRPFEVVMRDRSTMVEE
jgi:thioredoxin reductase (NADPH)